MATIQVQQEHWLETTTRGVLLGLMMAAVFFAGYIIRGEVTTTAENDNNGQNSLINDVRGFLGDDETEAPQLDTEFALLAEVQSLLTENYVRDLPDSTAMEYAAIRGYLGELNDPYTFFIEPPVAQNESEVLAGQYGGIGVQLQRKEDGVVALYPYPDSPAELAGVQNEDVLLAINGMAVQPTDDVTMLDRALRGEVGEGRGVLISVQTPDATEARDLYIEFAVVRVPSVIWRTLAEEPAFGYIQILRFSNPTPDELRTALSELEAQGIEALILDLRGNSGGLLQESVAVASEFLDGGVVYYEAQRDSETITNAESGGTALDIPLVVLVNQGTASASELVAGALQDRDRGTLIGQRTYGKGSVQLIFRLSDGSSVHITSAEWLTPSRAPLDGNGLEPNISMIPVDDGRDVELGEAIRFLQQLTGR
ncbi:MAG: S41 family peptidase [Chloroflexi bacterium]|nr:S41 family peptidase [Chloroflexota bacterium]